MFLLDEIISCTLGDLGKFIQWDMYCNVVRYDPYVLLGLKRCPIQGRCNAHQSHQIVQNLLVQQLILHEMRRRQVRTHVRLHQEHVEVSIEAEIEAHHLEEVAFVRICIQLQLHN